MKKRQSIVYLITPLLILLLNACTKEGAIIVNPVKEIRPLVMDGFVVGDTVEQYFDGIKVREFFGRVNLLGNISRVAFEKDNTTMELKKKSTGETIYKFTFNINQDTCEVPKFYFDGTTLHESFSYPKPQNNDYLVSLYLGFPVGSPAADLVAEIEEWGFTPDWDAVQLGTTTVTLASNIQPGKWSGYFKIEYGNLQQSDPLSFFQAIPYLKQAGTNKYYTGNNKQDNWVMVQLPDPLYGANDPMVQSFYIGLSEQDNKQVLTPQQNLIDIFR